MSKSVQVKVRVDKDGKIHATPHGTVGEECMSLLKMFDEINGIVVEECTLNDDYDKDINVTHIQHVGY